MREPRSVCVPRGRAGLIIPALNEELALPRVLADVPPGLFEFVIVVDNGSTDDTASCAAAAGAHVVREERRGYGSACLAGIAAALGSHADPRSRVAPPLGPGDLLAFCDADGSDYPEDLIRVVEPLFHGGCQLVIGSRILGGADMRAMLPQAWVGNRLACVLLRLLFGARATDLGPMRAIEVGALRSLQMRDGGFGWTIEMQIKAHCHGLVVAEVPVRYRPRIGKSKITGTTSGTIRAGSKILWWILGARLGWIKTRPRSPRFP